MRTRIALHACLPILNLGLDYYADWSSIVIYPGDSRRCTMNTRYEHGVVHHEIMDLCGQSLSHGQWCCLGKPSVRKTVRRTITIS